METRPFKDLSQLEKTYKVHTIYLSILVIYSSPFLSWYEKYKLTKAVIATVDLGDYLAVWFKYHTAETIEDALEKFIKYVQELCWRNNL